MNKNFSIFLRIPIYILVICLITPLISLFNLVRPEPYTTSITPDDYGIEYERVSFPTEDGIELKGWFLPSLDPEAEMTVVLLHGYPADKGDVLHRAEILIDSFDVFLFDFRYLGESGGKFTTLGALEQRDLHAALDFLEKEKGIKKVALWGYSMGAAVSIMVAPERDIVRGVVSDSSYSDLRSMATGLHRPPFLGRILDEAVLLWGRVFFGIKPSDVSPIKAAPFIEVPVFMVHSRGDKIIPIEQAFKLEEAFSKNPHFKSRFLDYDTHGAAGDRIYEEIKNFLLDL